MFNPIPMSSKVWAYMMLRLLPPSMSTLEKRVLPMMGVDNERVPTRLWDVVGVVLADEGNGVLRPVEVGWRGLGDGEDFSALALALPRGHVRCRPSEDEEVVFHRGKLVRPPLSSVPFFLSSSR